MRAEWTAAEEVDLLVATTRERETKAERMEVRLTSAAKSLLTQAAHMRRTTVSEFLISSAVRAAEDVLVSPRVFEVGTEHGWKTLADLLDPAPEATSNPELAVLLREAAAARD
jgi:uncharacterized protein (DUF1778 family)